MKGKTFIGLDIGGTKIAAGLVEGNKVIKSIKLKTDSESGADTVLEKIHSAVQQIWMPNISGIGLGIAGLTDHKRGVFLGGPNLPLKLAKIQLTKVLQRQYKVPVSIDNDVHCFTLAEAKLGIGKPFSSVFGLNLGTGIGGGLVINGQVYRGRNNGVGEVGHSMIALNAKDLCGCGQSGHFESLASGSAMWRIYGSLGGSRTDALEVEKRAKAGEVRAKEVFTVMSDALATGFANIILTLNPDVIVVGGGIAKVDLLWKTALKLTPGKIAYPALRTTPIVRAKLGPEANIIGAALMAQEKA